jgi:endonuclease/exonuclease/phosphatase family metal-dependent hydrolase
MILSFLAFAVSSFAAPLADKAITTDLHVMSYNIKGLPNAVLSDEYRDSRYPLIGRLLSSRQKADSPAIVLLQEAFSDQTKALLDAASYPHLAVGPGARSMLGVNGGLYILSRYPIEKTAIRAFGEGNCLSWDCLSNKGVQMARIRVPGLPRPLEVYNTHLQAGREDTPTRRRQVKILLDFYKEQHEAGNPVIFAGDFNFRPGLGQQSFLDFVKGTGFSHAGKICLDRGCAKGTDDGWHGIWHRAVDHQFYSMAGPVEIEPVSVERSYREPVENHKLSDHPAHEVRYRLKFKPVDPGRTVASEK